MADTILGGRWKVFYEAENRQKRIWRDTSVTPTVTDSVNALYSALQDLFDELTQLDDGTPMSAQTPTEYTIGIIDTGSKDPWFIDRVSTEYLYGGAIRTNAWTRATTSNTGIVRLDYTVGAGTDFATSDIGKTVTHSVGLDSGTLLDFVSDGSNGTAWIRPDSFAAGNDWDSTGGNIAVTGGTGAGLSQDAAASSGESLWANVFTIGTIEDNTHIYIRQDESTTPQLLTGYKSTTDWWGDGHVDLLVNVKEVGLEIDEGVIQVFARQHSKTYDHFEVDLTAGGRNPVPLSTGKDLDNQVGYRQMVFSVSSGDFQVGEEIRDDSTTPDARGIVTSWDSGTTTIQYYLIGDPVSNDFSASTGTLTGLTSLATATAVNPTNVNAAVDTDITITILADAFDVNENDVNELYSIVVDCNNKSLTKVQQRLKYITRRGETTDLDASSSTIPGQFYIGSDRRIIYDTLTGTISTGDQVTQLNTGATGTVVAHHTSAKIIILRNSRGTFSSNTVADQIQVDGSNYVTLANDSGATNVSVIVPTKASPFGTFAGGKFFGAPGVVLDNVHPDDASNYQLIDDTGTVVVPPTKVPVTIANTIAGDKVAAFRLTETNGIIKKTPDGDPRGAYNATVQTIGATTAVMGTSIAIDEPGKTSGGILRLVDVSAQTEYRIRFGSWTGTTFKLYGHADHGNTTGLTADASGCTSTQLTDTGQSFTTTVKVGDIIRNITEGVIAYVKSVDSNTVLQTTAVTDWTSDSYEINTLPVTTTTSPQDTWYVPLIDSYETTGTTGTPGNESVTITFNAAIPIRVRARNAGNILPFEQDTSVGATGVSVSIIRTADSIFTA